MEFRGADLRCADLRCSSSTLGVDWGPAGLFDAQRLLRRRPPPAAAVKHTPHFHLNFNNRSVLHFPRPAARLKRCH